MPVTLYSGQVTLTIEAALSAATSSYGIWNTGLWDTALWGPDVVWTDVSAYMESCTTQRNFARELQVWQPGTARIVLNNLDGRFSSANLGGPYVTGGITQIRPWRPIRVRAAYGGVTYDIFRGYAIAWEEDLSIGTGDAVVVVSCVDEYGRLARFNGAAGSGPVGAGERSGLRIHRLLDFAGHTGTRVVDMGQFTVQATTLGSNVANEATLTAESEAGVFYVEADGSSVFENGYALIENRRSNTVQATFGDDTAGVELEYVDVKKRYDGDLMVNTAAFQRVGGTVQTATDQDSRSLYVPSQYPRSDLICETDAQVLQLANWYVTRYAQPEDRITQIQIDPRANSALWPHALGRRVRDLVRAVRRRDTYTITRDCHISGISHTLTDLDWTTTFDLWSATPYQSVGRWDSATWDTSKWFF